MSIKKEDIINPDFATSTHYGDQSLTEEQLKQKLENEPLMYRLFVKRGHLTSKEYSFITYATFSDSINSELEGKWSGEKTPEQKQQAGRMILIVEDYFNSIYLDGDIQKEPLEVAFIARHDHECALYNPNRLSYNKINEILIEFFR